MLAKCKWNSIKLLIFKTFFDQVISPDEFVLINNVLKEYNRMKKKSKIDRLNQFIKDFSLFIKQCYRIIVWSVEKIQSVKIQKLQGQKTEECFLSDCVVYESKKSNIIKQQEANGSLSSLRINTP